MTYDDETLRALQLVELDVLKAIDSVCRKHGIAYFLDSGTALGAARHQGFIPWDDDIDIGMLREDYERFLELAPEELGSEYVVAKPGSLTGYAAMFSKVWKRGTVFQTQETMESGLPQGVFVDVFPYDPLHADPLMREKQKAAGRRWQRISYLYHAKTITVPHKGLLGAVESLACRVAHHAVRAVLSEERIRKSFGWAERIGYESPTEEFMCMSYVMDSGLPLDVLMPPSSLRFEDAEFSCPHNTPAYLEAVFGSGWTELPPLDQRRNHAPIVLDLGAGTIEH